AASKIKSATSDTVARVKEETTRVATEKKDTAAQRLGDYSSAIHESAQSLEEKDPNLAWLTHRAADKLQGVADYVRNRDFAKLRQDVEGVARRHPAAFFGGLFVVGLVLGNVVKASRRNADDADESGAAGNDAASWDEHSREEPDALNQEELTAAERDAAGI
ncbi:MAG: hypothetical protein ABIR80_18195, partial [Opitutaceae bacterium]